jgi:haloacetate dehalogenase
VFEGFQLETVDTGEARIVVRHGGSGPPLLLLHGSPQTHLMWHTVGPRLARDFTVYAADLRGYGDSSKPTTTADHEPYSKRSMARDMVAVMEHFGHQRFALAGHDRGGRVGYRLALDYPDRVSQLAVLDIVPTGEAFRRADASFGMTNWHWFFLAQPYDLPERLIGNDPEYYFLGRRAANPFAPEALEEYLRCFRNPETIHAICEDYRAGITLDYPRDEADYAEGRKIACPTLVLWGGRGQLPKHYDVLSVWRDWANDVQGQGLDCGHYLVEERPDETYAALHAFFTA